MPGMFLAKKTVPQDLLLMHLEREISTQCLFAHSFYAKLCAYIDRRGYKSDAEFYRAVGISRQSFSRIRNAGNAGLLPSRRNILAMAVELALSESEAVELLSAAGYTFRNDQKSDVILRYFFKEQLYDRFAIDDALTYFGETPLFSCL